MRISAKILTAAIVCSACSAGSDKAADSTAAVTVDSAAPVVAPVTEPSTAASTTASTVIVPININTATDKEILAIPGLGPKMLHEFKEYRPYTSIEQFRREIGKYVDKAEVARLEQYIVVK
ncbi:MAG: helix-hairpin-helix domain-containing protein [Gemmatimonadaceae bacterium]|nr:helix-hairpin-helix domain-containing protein [Gemmatimonadaceae bacterium]